MIAWIRRGNISKEAVGFSILLSSGYEEALASIEAHALIMPGTKDILHPPDDSRLAAEQMPNARLAEIDSEHGHLGGGGVDQDDIDFINEEMTSFFNELRNQ